MTGRAPAYLRAPVCIVVAVLLGFTPLVHARAADLQSVHHFSIPPQSLDTALLAFSDQAKVQVLMQGGAKADARSSGAVGELISLDALLTILRNTGFGYEQIDEETVAIVPARNQPSETSLESDRKLWPIRLAQGGPPSAQDANQQSQAAPEDLQSSKTQTTGPAPVQEGRGSQAKLEEVVVTGSLIQRADLETPSPVQVISAAQIQQSGYTNISDVMRNLPASGQGALSQGNGTALAAGASGVALRGLTVGGTLTLIDGQRMVAYPLSDDNQRSLVDVSAIPFNAIDRVEVLKDGASAIYGADAIAGVVNIILKKTYVGTEMTAEGGISQRGDGATSHFAAISGIGDLTKDGHNAYIAVDFHHQNPILAADRSGDVSTLDWSGYPGGVNTTPGAGTNPFIPFPASVTGYLVDPNSGATTYLPGCTAAAQAANQCTFTYRGLQIQPTTQQLNILGKLTLRMGENWQSSITASLFNSRAAQVDSAYASTNYPGATLIPIGPGLQPSIIPYTFTVPANYPGNTTGTTQDLVYSFHELGIPGIRTDTNTYRLLANVKGTQAGWDIDATIGVMYSRMQERLLGFIEPQGLQAALNNGYLVGSGASSAAAAALFAPVADETPTSSLGIVDVHGSRTLLPLPGGPLALAAGFQFFQKRLNDPPFPSVQAGLQEDNAIYAVGSQSAASAFLELDAVPLEQLELNGAVRYDHYNTYGGSTTPKFGIKYTPWEPLAVRATWGKGFRAPSIAESSQSGGVGGAGSVPDPVLCPHPANITAAGNFPSQCSVALLGYDFANPNLRAVTSTDLTAGLLIQPVKSLNVSIDYYRINLQNDIISAYNAGGLLNYTSLVRGPPALEPYCVSDGNCATIMTTPVGRAAFATYPYVNAGKTTTSGIDLSVQSRIDLGALGGLTTSLDFTHMLEYNYLYQGVMYQLAGTHGPSSVSGDTGTPRDRATLSLAWSRGPANVTASLNYTSTFSITDPTAGFSTCEEALLGSGATYGARFTPNATIPASLCYVHDFVELNLYARYEVSSHLALHAAITNLLDRGASLDMQTYGGGGQMAYNSAYQQDGVVGRYFTLGATYRF